jgi:hypothetical protein
MRFWDRVDLGQDWWWWSIGDGVGGLRRRGQPEPEPPLLLWQKSERQLRRPERRRGSIAQRRRRRRRGHCGSEASGGVIDVRRDQGRTGCWGWPGGRVSYKKEARALTRVPLPAADTCSLLVKPSAGRCSPMPPSSRASVGSGRVCATVAAGPPWPHPIGSSVVTGRQVNWFVTGRSSSACAGQPSLTLSAPKTWP